MTAGVGSAALLIAAPLALYGIGALLRGTRRGDARWLASGRMAVLGVFGFVTLAVVMMEAALIRFDFSVRYVAANVNLATPLPFRIVGLWGALEGSILFWQWLLALFAAVIAVRYRDRDPQTPYALTVLLAISAFFLFMMLGPADPFARLPVPPADGRGLNPLLQNHPLMAVHPPLLYLGYVGFSVPYAFAMASLLSGPATDAWLTAARPWMLVAWTALTAGLFLGARWSYDVLGWGGYWGWDPVENAAFLPWLVGTALLHSAMVQSHRGQMRMWNLALVILTFLLTIFGTFLTRSGVLASVHAFTQSLIGPLFLAFLAVAALSSLTVMLLRGPQRTGGGTFDGYFCRETAMVANNLILLGLAFSVFFGTVFPLLVEAATAARVSVGAPFYTRVFVPLGMLLLVVMGAGTVMRWGPSTPEDLRRLGGIAAAALLTAGGLALGGVVGTLTVAGLALVAFMAYAQGVEIWRGAAAGQRTGQGWLRTLRLLFAANPQRYFGYVTHLGLAIVIVGIIASTSYRTEVERGLSPGESTQIGSYALRYDGPERTARPDKTVLAARVALAMTGGNALAAAPGTPQSAVILRPSLNVYQQSRTPVATPAVRSSWRDDVYVVLMGMEEGSNRAVFKVIWSPLVAWIWAGGALMVAAGILNLWPRARARPTS